ncbi:ABC transporter permease [Alicyclobacillus curvatus]|nr:ABC transporter permease [Alicyclobacillus curvatus]
MAVTERDIAPTSAVKSYTGRRPRADFVKRLFRQPRTWIAGCVILVFVVTAITAPWISPLDPNKVYSQGLSAIGAPLPPGSGHFLLGTDEVGRDVLSRIIWGSRISIGVGIGATVVTLILGVIIGVTAGFYQNFVDTIFMRLADMFLAFPFVLFVVFVATIFRPSLLVIVLAIGILSWAPMARIARSRTMELRNSLFVEAARIEGASNLRIMWRHLLPNVIGTVFAYGLLQVGTNITLESALSYLGAGPPPPTPDWGAMVAEGQGAMSTAPWLFFIPGICIMLTVVAFNLLGDSWLRAANRSRR